MHTTEKELRENLYGNTTDLTENESGCIIKYLQKFERPRYLEIGVWYCGTFCKVLDFLKQDKKEFYAIGVDLFESILNEERIPCPNGGSATYVGTHKLSNKWNTLNVAYHDNIVRSLKERGYENFSLLKGHSDKVITENRLDADVCFIDGSHTYKQTKKDAENCIVLAKPGSYIIFHNASNDQQPDIQYVKRDGGPWKVCKELKSDIRVEFMEKSDRCMVYKRV
jgi:hypothetical protein